MKTLSEILLESSKTQKSELKKIIDKSIPSGIIDKRIDMLEIESPDAVLSLIKFNSLLRNIILSEVNYIEDMLSTGVYNTKFGKVKCNDIIEKDEYKDFWPKDVKEKSKNILKKIINKKEENKDKTLFEIFALQTLFGKITIVKLMDRENITKLIRSKKNKFTKKDLMNLLEYSRRVRNHVAHSFFVLNKGPYLRMLEHNDVEKYNLLEDLDKIRFLFSKLETLLKINGRPPIIKIAKKESIARKGINLKLLDLIIIKI